MASRASVRCLRLASTRLCTSGKPGSSIEVNAARCLSSSLGHHAQKKGRNDKKSEGSVYRTYNQPGVPADRGGMSIDELIEERVLPKKQSTAYAMDPEWTADLDETTIGLILEEFMRRPLVRQQAAEAGVTDKLFMKSYLSFRELCKDFSTAEPSLIVTLKDIIQDKHDVERLYPFFLAHARRVFPHLEAMDDLRIISDLTQPHNWYPEARTIQRKIFFHSGPTNSGKTFHALKRFKEAKSGVFCGPLKLLASEVFIRCQAEGFKCDMVTGEERRFAVDNLHPSPHLSCTVEMLSTSMRIEVAVIDEIQMLRDDQRGWAWTRALLGVAADEVHLCGEPAAIPMVRKLLEPIGETLEVLEYERKTPLVIADRGLGNLTEVRPADCIVCFSKKTIFSVSKKLEMLGIKTAVIYGDLPPATKLAQATKFNDPNDPINVLVATDAIGMGLNLNIRRIIFSQVTRQGKLLPNYNALQIAGRAGRFGTEHEGGVVTTLRPTDLGTLKDIMSQTIQPIARAGISPTYDQIETFSFHLPQASFVRLLDIFVSVCSVSDHFFICTVDQMKELAQFIDRIPLPLKIRYTLCCVPLSMSNKFTEAVFVKIARRLSQGQSVSADWVFDLVGWPLAPVESLEDLFNLELVYEILDSYLWLSLRFPDLFPDEEVVREGSRQIDGLIRLGIDNLMNLVPQVEERRGPRGVREAEVVEEEEDEKPKRDLKLPTKRRGNPRSIVESLISKGILSGDDAAVLKQSLFARLDQNAKDREEEEKVEREEKEQTAKDDKKEMEEPPLLEGTADAPVLAPEHPQEATTADTSSAIEPLEVPMELTPGNADKMDEPSSSSLNEAAAKQRAAIAPEKEEANPEAVEAEVDEATEVDRKGERRAQRVHSGMAAMLAMMRDSTGEEMKKEEAVLVSSGDATNVDGGRKLNRKERRALMQQEGGFPSSTHKEAKAVEMATPVQEEPPPPVPKATRVTLLPGSRLPSSPLLIERDAFAQKEARKGYEPVHAGNNYLKTCAWSPNGSHLATTSQDRHLRIFEWDADGKLSLLCERSQGGLIYDSAWHPGGEAVATSAKDCPIHLWNAAGERVVSFRGINHLDELASANSLAFSVDGTKLYAGYHKYLRIFDVSRPGRQVRELKTWSREWGGQKALLSCIAVHPFYDGVYAVGCYGRSVAQYSDRSSRADCLFSHEWQALTQLQFSADGMRLYGSTRNSEVVACWDMRMPGAVLATFHREGFGNLRIAFALDGSGSHLISGDSHGAVHIYDTLQATGEGIEPSSSCTGADSAVVGVSLHPSQPVLATASGERVFRVMDLSEDEDVSESPEKKLRTTLETVEVSPTEESRYSEGARPLDNCLKLWKLENDAVSVQSEEMV